ncbi:substrate-binding periplasmic protein [Roseibium sediminicola]|uniref:Transporter substrate-binding domain-containing protein n=1 Tax=Roseibium sediminicola TaxID=2933272 RepID=A0ABT0H2S4_9HYPH|nr:transporter substrate-binding domain-containing protein [Roseibium sp. CAU 1639]MCK7615388.1 transporter substrate-binding domain-containing protein [Roseibium sp. CAU 1639]
MRILASSLLCILLGLSSPHALADTFRVASPHLEGLVNEDGVSGMLIGAVTEIFRKAGHTVEFSVVPSRRVPVLLRQGEVDFAMPILEIEMFEYQDFNTTRTLPMIFRRDFVFVREGMPIPHKPEELRGKTLAATLGYGLDPTILEDKDITITYTNSDHSAVSMVDRGRVDAYLSDEFVVRQAMKKAGIDSLIHDPEKPMFVYGAALVGSQPRAVLLIETLNDAISAMWRDGSLQQHLPFNNVEDFEIYIARNPDNS